MILRKGTCLLFLLLHASFGYPQGTIKLQQLSVKEGLSNNTINFIFQDSRGFIWIGTQDGLNRYDGSNVLIYKNKDQDTTSIASNEIYSVSEDVDGNLWFGTGWGLSSYSHGIDGFINYEFLSQSGHTMRPVWGMVQSPADGKLWLGASGGLFSFDIDEASFDHYVINDSLEFANSAISIEMDQKGKLWIGTSNGSLLTFDQKSKVFERLNYVPDAKKGDKHGITAVLEDSEENVWFGREDGLLGLAKYIGENQIRYSHFNCQYPIIDLFETKSGQLWIGTDKGGCQIFNRRTNQFEMLKTKVQGGSNVVRTVFGDVQDNIWIGSYHGGAFLFDPIDTAFSNIKPYPEIEQENNLNSVSSVFRDENDLWMGTDGGGLVRQGQRNYAVYLQDENSNAIAGNTILCMTPDRNDTLYIGTYANGLSILDRGTGNFYNYNRSNGLSDNSVYTTLLDGDYLWIGTNKGGLNLLNTKTGAFKYFESDVRATNAISANTIRSLFKDSRNKLWVGTVSGLNRLNELDSTFYVFNHHSGKYKIEHPNILCIYEDEKSNMWFGTHGSGLIKYDYHQDTFTVYKESDGCGGDIVYKILGDRNGNLWMSTNKGISKYDIQLGQFKNFEAGGRLPNAQFNVGSAFLSNDGRMYFGHSEGLCSFVPHYIRQNRYQPPVIVTEFTLFNKTIVPGVNSPLRESITETRQIELEHDQSVFGFRFSALNYSHAERNTYAYRLLPFDKQWIYTGNSNQTAGYANLSPGEYEFQVKAANNDGIWNETPTTIKINILPPFWKTNWFRLVLAAFIVLLVYGGYQIKLRRIRLQKLALSKLVEQRTAEKHEKNQMLIEAQMANKDLLNQKLNQELEVKSKELLNYTLLIIQKNKLLEDLKRKIREAMKKPGSFDFPYLRGLLRTINQNFNSQKEWGEFSTNFNLVHKNFTDSLKERFPDLTLNDLRLCALYRIGLPSKEIADVMGISQTSVKMARYRLRKKLGLTPEEDIHAFVMNLDDAEQIK